MTMIRSIRAAICIGLFCGVVSTSRTAAAQITGSVDVVNLQSVLGWTCDPTTPDSKLVIWLYAYDASAGSWVYLYAGPADKQRNDIGRTGICGPTWGIESYYHGFELPVYPDGVLNKGKSYYIYAWASQGWQGAWQMLTGSGGLIGYAEAGLPTRMVWRTDYDDRNLTSPALISCIWPYLGANARCNPITQEGCASIADVMLAGGTQPPQYLGFATPSNSCINFDSLQTGSPPPAWQSSNASTNAPAGEWPMSNYWVLHVNNEVALDRVGNSGPPSQSEPIDGRLFGVSAGSDSITLAINNGATNYKPEKIPFLSFGATLGRGGGPLAFIDPSGPDTNLEVTVTKQLQQGGVSPVPYHGIWIYIETIFGGQKQVAIVTLQEAASARKRWNWNVFPSFWYPGAEFHMFSVANLQSQCALQGAALQDMTNAPIGVSQNIRIPLRGLFECIDALPGNDPKAWVTPRPAGRPLMISGVHFAIEQGDGRPQDAMQVTFSRPQLTHAPTVPPTTCVTNAACTVDLSMCAEWQKASAWQGLTTLQGSMVLASYTSHLNWVCQTTILQAWPVIPEPGWWCGSVVNSCRCSVADGCR